MRGNTTDDNVQGTALEVTRKPSKCYHCKQFGHVAKNCKNKKATSIYNSEATSSEPAVRHKKNQYKPKKNAMTLSALTIDVKQDGWYIDSGASCHMCNNKDIMTDYEELPNKLQLQVANGDKLFGIGKGNVEVRVKSEILPVGYRKLRTHAITNNMSQKRPSGSEFRKRKRVREMEAKKMENTLRKWTVTQQENSQEDVSNDDVLALTGMSGTKSGNNLKIIYKEKEDNPVNPSQQDLTLPITTSPSSEIQIEKAAATDKIQLDINDPVSWLPLTDHIRCFLVEKGPDQGKVSQNISSTEDAGRKFNIHWFTKKMSNGEMVPRSWLIYSKKRDAIFCFPCILFGSSSTKQIMPALADAQKGFNDWRHLSPRIPEHENSTFHRENCIKWKMLEQKIKRKTTIDASLQKAIDQETNKWRHILKVCTNILLFCAENNLPLRGSHERIGESGSGVFLSAVDMISKFDPELRAHIESLHKGNISYFTPYIQNELIDILASEIQTTNDYNAETISTAKSIMDQINYKFICTLQIWDKILESVDKVNVALQSKTMTIDKASELIKGLTNQIQNIRETIDIVFEKAKKICEQCGIEDNFPEKRRKRVKRHDLIESSDSGYDITQQQSFKIQINEAIDTIISELKWRFEKLRDIHNSFGFLTLKHITTYSVEELKKYAADLSIKYSADINATEFWSEIETLKSQVEATTLFDNCECQSSMGLLKAIVELDLKEMFPNIVVILKIFLTMPVTVASCERSFSKLKLIKTYLRSTMGQERLSGLAILSIERDIARLLSYENVIKDFAMRKARKVNL
ncbi:hypothetical protein ACJJTC_001993 [Scirpophaga incertulas]